MDRVGTRSFYRPLSWGYIGCRSTDDVEARGRNLMVIYPGYIEFPADLAPEDANEWSGITLSSFRPHEAGRPRKREPQVHECGYVLPATGICDYCE